MALPQTLFWASHDPSHDPSPEGRSGSEAASAGLLSLCVGAETRGWDSREQPEFSQQRPAERQQCLLVTSPECLRPREEAEEAPETHCGLEMKAAAGNFDEFFTESQRCCAVEPENGCWSSKVPHLGADFFSFSTFRTLLFHHQASFHLLVSPPPPTQPHNGAALTKGASL